MDTVLLLIYSIVFIVHNIIFFNLIQRMIPQKKSNEIMYAISVLNTIGWILLTVGVNSIVAYLFLFIVIVMEVKYLFETDWAEAMVGLTLPLHIIPLKLVLTGAVALSTRTSVYSIINHELINWIVMIVVSLMLSGLTLGLVLATKGSDVLTMTERKYRLYLFCVLEVLNVAILMANSLTQMLEIESAFYSIQQLILGFGTLSMLYVGMGIMKELDVVAKDFAEKEQDLIIKAERDSLVGAYNKAITEQLIDDFLIQL